MLPRRRCPVWFEVVVAVTLALALRELDAWHPRADVAGGDGAAPQLAFWPVVILVASAIWKGLEVAGRITLEILKWSVLQLWSFAKLTYNALKAVGLEVVKGARRSWDFLADTYEHVLKPAWDQFWKWFDRAKKWLEDIFAPVFRWLQFVRQWVLDFYAKYVRPILDAIGIAQRVLRVFEALGLEWARKLDAQLAELQRRIDAPFRLVLAKINEIVNLVNRIVTLDGLFQRVALIRSIERDIREVSRAFGNWRSVPISNEELMEITRPARDRTPDDVGRDFASSIDGEGGRYGPLVAEMRAQWTAHIDRAR